MFVEDCPDVRALYGPALRSAGLIVDEVATLTEAIVFLERTEPDVVVLDRDLPDGDGFEVAAFVRTLQASTRVLAFTADAERSARSAAEAAGCHAFIVKPCAPARLVHEVLALVAPSDSRIRCA